MGRLRENGLMLFDGEACRRMRAMSEILIAEQGWLPEDRRLICCHLVNDYLRGRYSEEKIREAMCAVAATGHLPGWYRQDESFSPAPWT